MIVTPLEENNLYMVILILVRRSETEMVLEWIQKRIREEKLPESAINIVRRAINDA
jgi:hypothetical protein